MKRILLAVLVFFLLCSVGWADGTCTPSYSSADQSRTIYTITYTCTADAVAATFPSTVFNPGIMEALKNGGYYLYEVYVSSGATAATATTDITATDSRGLDLLGGAGTSRTDFDSDCRFFPKNSDGGYAYVPVTDTSWTLAIANNAVGSAILYIDFVFVK